MKVGIITFHRVNNYGAVLQAYALQKTIQRLGCECDIIDYNRKNLRDILLWQKSKIRSFLKGTPDRQGYSNTEFMNMVLTTVFFNKKTVADKFDSFRKRMNLSRAVNSDTIKDLNREYDLFISGSDQVWNCGRVILDKNYLLGFVEDGEKKASYGASFGIKEIPDKYLEDYKELLSGFKYLAVREEAGADLVRRLAGREAKVVLDPTLLFKKEDWGMLIGKRSAKKEAVVVYMLEYSENLLRFAGKLSKRVNCPVRLLNKPFHHRTKEEYRTDVGPVEWLSQLQNASYVVTNSYHGVVFSINFNRNFYVEIAEERIRGAMASRIEHILKTFGLEDRLIQKEETDPQKENSKFRFSTKDMDYGKVNEKLKELRGDSMDYLKRILVH